MRVRLVLAPVLALLTTACMTDGRMRELDARFEAGWRPGKAYCVAGGETPTLDAWCARVNFGAEALVLIARAANAGILEQAGDGPLPCLEHVAQVRARLAGQPDYEVTALYSCPDDPPLVNGRPVCHASVLVTDRASRARVVIDNGHVLSAAVYGGVAPYQEFAQRVDRMWAGMPPDGLAFANR